jgi:hypothetical protein
LMTIISLAPISDHIAYLQMRCYAIFEGIIRRLPAGFKGEQFPFCFTWSEDRTIWGMGSGTATFYNTSLDSKN